MAAPTLDPTTDGHAGPMAYVWSYRVKADRIDAFRAAYGPDGEWAAFFRASPGYLGAELLEDAATPGRFVTVDRFATAEARDALLAERRAQYEAIDAKWARAGMARRMRSPPIVAVLAALASAASLASAAAGQAPIVRCAPVVQPDLGLVPESSRTSCVTADGETVQAYRDPTGELVIREDDGDAIHGATDAFGVTTFRPEPPRPLAPGRYLAFPDGIGGVVFRDESGETFSAVADPLGASTVNTGRGVVRCWTDPVGVTTCD